MDLMQAPLSTECHVDDVITIHCARNLETAAARVALDCSANSEDPAWGHVVASSLRVVLSSWDMIARNGSRYVKVLNVVASKTVALPCNV
jgi:hypothetical protein